MGNFSSEIVTNENSVRFYVRCEKKIKLLSSELNIFCYSSQKSAFAFNGAVMQIEKALINGLLHDVKVSWNFRTPNICNFAVILPWNLPFFKKVAYFLTGSFVFINKTLRLNNSKTRTAVNEKISVFVLFVLKRWSNHIFLIT